MSSTHTAPLSETDKELEATYTSALHTGLKTIPETLSRDFTLLTPKRGEIGMDSGEPFCILRRDKPVLLAADTDEDPGKTWRVPLGYTKSVPTQMSLLQALHDADTVKKIAEKQVMDIRASFEEAIDRLFAHYDQLVLGGEAPQEPLEKSGIIFVRPAEFSFADLRRYEQAYSLTGYMLAGIAINPGPGAQTAAGTDAGAS